MANSCNYDLSTSNLGENLIEDDAVEIEQPMGTSRPSVWPDTVSRTRAARDTEVCINRIPKNTFACLAQIVVVYGIISVSLYHLSAQLPNQELWLVLLSSAFGYILPSPGLKNLKRSRETSKIKLQLVSPVSETVSQAESVMKTKRANSSKTNKKPKSNSGKIKKRSTTKNRIG